MSAAEGRTGATRPAVKSLTLVLTTRCPLACPYCSQGSAMPNMDMPPEVLEKALALYREKLGALSPAAKLSAGYALVSDRNGNRITSALAAREAGRLSLWFGDGNVNVKVTGGEDGKDDKSDQ